MPLSIRTLMGPSQQPKGKLVGFKTLRENFSYYALDDGTVLGVKPSVVMVYRALNPDNSLASSPDGTPLYFYTTQNITQVLKPEEYRSFKGDGIAD
jgi:hypothetical protein